MKCRLLIFTASLLLLPALIPAHAHTGAGVVAPGYLTGILHPLSGIDHVLVMLGIGLCGGASGGRLRWLLPVVFLSFMAGGQGLILPGFTCRRRRPGLAFRYWRRD